METAPGSPRLGLTEMQYVTHSLHKMQKHNFGVMYPGALFVEIASSPPEHEK
jgi:hypothetical protein